jgi:hypothetical protein
MHLSLMTGQKRPGFKPDLLSLSYFPVYQDFFLVVFLAAAFFAGAFFAAGFFSGSTSVIE